MVRLYILKEDLYLEVRGMVHEPMPALDESSSDWREIYFFRNSVGTLLEIRSAIETLRREKSFIRALSGQPPPLNRAFDDLTKALNRADSLIKKLRNEVAGHLPDKAFAEALDKIGSDTRGLLQMGNSAKEIHYKFSPEFLGATMLRHVAYQDVEKEWQKMCKTTLRLSFQAIRAIDTLFVAYSRIHDLSF